jgi:hypothetical protein
VSTVRPGGGTGGGGTGGGAVASVNGQIGTVILGADNIAEGASHLFLTASERTAIAGASAPTLANIPAGSTLTVQSTAGTWPARPTSRADVIVIWKGPDPSPAIVSSGTGGMRDGIDIRFVTD